MKIKAYFIVVCSCIILSLIGCSSSKSLAEASADSVTTIYLVRHAEKEANTNNPRLTAQGHQRAKALAELLEDKPLAVVFSTDYYRTIETATPAAKYHSIEVQFYDPYEQEGFAKQLKKEFPNKTILIVGHSNTIPALINLLDDNSNIQQLGHDEYNQLFTITLANGAAEVVIDEFGE